MQKPIYLTGTCALFVAVAIFVWSKNAPVSSRTNTASSSTEMMINFKNPLPIEELPIEEWDAF